MTLTPYLLAAQHNGELGFDWILGQWYSTHHDDVPMHLAPINNGNDVVVAFDALDREMVVSSWDALAETFEWYVKRGWEESPTENVEIVTTKNGETIQDDEPEAPLPDFDAVFVQVEDELEAAQGVDELILVSNHWHELYRQLKDNNVWEDFADDMTLLSDDIQAALTEAKQKEDEKAKPSTNGKRPSVSLKKKELQPPIEGESVQTYIVRVLKNDFSYNPTLNKKLFRIPNADASKVGTQLTPYLDKYYPDLDIANGALKLRQNGKDVDIVINEQPEPLIISDATKLDDAVRLVRKAYDLKALGLCDSSDEYDCASEVAGLLLDIAAEDGDVDLTKPLEEYIDLGEDE